MKTSRRKFLAATLIPTLSGSIMMRAGKAQTIASSPSAGTDMTDALQSAIDSAANTGHLSLPAGQFATRGLRLPSRFMLSGVPGATELIHLGDDPLLGAEDESDIVVSGLSLDGSGAGGELWHRGLVHFSKCENVTIRDCAIANTGLNGISLLGTSGRVDNCQISGSAYTGLFIYDGAGVFVSGNTISRCHNGGIRVWRGEAGADGTIISGNRINAIDWADGGNGQNGNGINIFRADEVIVSDNHISDCAFSAIRLNATNNTQISGNVCVASGEVAVFSEFSFTGSIISGNIIDGAAAGISMTNFNDGGRLAVCTGNIVRNLYARSETNPDLDAPYGIAAEADAIISDNVVENVPGTGITAGWGPFLRDVTINGNLVRDIDVGIAVSVAEGAGTATVTGNTIIGARRQAMVGAAWHETVSNDLAAEAERFPLIVMDGNRSL
ncbi:TIGR03808 family TAT-translocated repetitive protein [Pelagibacterium sp.]|uniref:TIGR03808 family TAT-translocated repetitive protein n=1 Tax=Pelagibacterium sp. TaxID=1967288 RepID=UPI003A940B8D